MEVGENFQIKLRLGSKMFPITIKRTDEENYRAAEKLINEKYNFYAGRYPNQGDASYFCMAALDIALSLKRNESQNDTKPFVDCIQELVKEIDESLK
ncbi:MAG: cell division protein ZapA [Clostridium sp.]|nr:cell division protein ZapA [Clostridium sp.]